MAAPSQKPAVTRSPIRWRSVVKVIGVLLTIDLGVAVFYFGAIAGSKLRSPAKTADRVPVVDNANAPFKRRDLLTADELSRQLLAVPELDLDSQPGTTERIVEDAQDRDPIFAHPIFEPLQRRAELQGLPLAMGADCRIRKESAEDLQVLSRNLRLNLSQSLPPGGLDTRFNADILRKKIASEIEWQQADALPTLVQMLQTEDRPIRLLLVEQLSKIKGHAASAALARRALFDLSADVREAAVDALKGRPRDEYRQLLLDGLRYPWPPSADHAAEALVALNDPESLRTLVELLGEPDPTGPMLHAFHKADRSQIYTPRHVNEMALTLVALDERQGNERRTALLADLRERTQPAEVSVVREVVRVNHLHNCLLCHPASVAENDLVRGFIPNPTQPLPPLVGYYDRRSGDFVHADVTYLRQDFSVPQPVANPGVWPTYQRFDYVVRLRYATEEERRRSAPETYPQREAVRWALRELRGGKGD